MSFSTLSGSLLLSLLFTAVVPAAQTVPREQWGGPLVSVTHADGSWVIAGRTNRVSLNEKTLAIEVRAGSSDWAMPASPADLLVRSGGQEFGLRLAEAKKKEFVRYDTGFKTGVKITLSDWASPALRPDLT